MEVWRAGFWKNWNHRTRFWGAKRRLLKHWDRCRQYWGAKRRLWKNWKCCMQIWGAKRRLWKNWSRRRWFWGAKRRLLKTLNRRFWGMKRRLVKNLNRRFWGVKCRLLKNWPQPSFEARGARFWKMEYPPVWRREVPVFENLTLQTFSFLSGHHLGSIFLVGNSKNFLGLCPRTPFNELAWLARILIETQILQRISGELHFSYRESKKISWGLRPRPPSLLGSLRSPKSLSRH